MPFLVRPREAPGLFKHAHDLFVRNLLKVPVPEADSFEFSRQQETNEIVGLWAQELSGLGCADGYGENEPVRVQAP